MADEDENTLSFTTGCQNLKVNEKAGQSGSQTQKIGKKLFFVSVFVLIVGILAALYWNNSQYSNSEYFEKYGVESTYQTFLAFDEDQDGFLSYREFQKAYLTIKNGDKNISEIEKDHFHTDVKEELLVEEFGNDDAVLNLKAVLKPIDLKTMTKFEKDWDPSSLHHLKGLTSWQSPYIEYANFSVSNFSVLLPQAKNLKVGDKWELLPNIPYSLLNSLLNSGDHLPGNRYLPPVPNSPIEKMLIYTLSMLHKRPFLFMRFPPRGAVASLRAMNDEYYEIHFRIHPEFQLNDPPSYPFWFTPAAIIGELIMKKDGSHVEYLKMYLPTRKRLNIDMEWMTGPPDPDQNANQEVDIGYVEEMSITSTQPSTSKDKLTVKTTTAEKPTHISWDSEISEDEMFRILELHFYPFKQVPYLPFNKTFEVAQDENKLIHHILLWGSLDDQSC